MYTCIIIDDEAVATAHLRKLIAENPILKLVKNFDSASEGIEYLKENDIDIVFLDIYMPTQTGIEAATKITTTSSIIFTTSSALHAIDAYNLGVVDYLLKPIEAERFDIAVNKAINRLQAIKKNDNNNAIIETKTLTVLADRKVHKIDILDIIYIESMHEYICYYTKKGKILSLGALKDVVTLLPEKHFIRVHKSYCINKNEVVNYSSTTVRLSNNTELPIGRVYKDDFKEHIIVHSK